MLVRIARLFLIVLAVALLAPLAARAQKVPAAPSLPASADASNPDSPFAGTNPPDPGREHMLHSMSLERSKIRQKQIVDDTQQLLDLAKQLQDAVAKSNKDELSLSVVNTAAEIEKLAKTVKEKMRDGD